MSDPATPSTGRGAVWRIARFVVFTYVCVVGFVYLYQRKLQYLPTADSPTPPDWAVTNGLEEFTVTTQDQVTLRGWYWPGERPVTLVIFHGNGGNRGHRLFWMGNVPIESH